MKGTVRVTRGPIVKDKLGVVPEPLDGGEDVVPATDIETGRVVPELVDKLVHLKGGEEGLNEADAEWCRGEDQARTGQG